MTFSAGHLCGLAFGVLLIVVAGYGWWSHQHGFTKTTKPRTRRSHPFAPKPRYASDVLGLDRREIDALWPLQDEISSDDGLFEDEISSDDGLSEDEQPKSGVSTKSPDQPQLPQCYDDVKQSFLGNTTSDKRSELIKIVRNKRYIEAAAKIVYEQFDGHRGVRLTFSNVKPFFEEVLVRSKIDALEFPMWTRSMIATIGVRWLDASVAQIIAYDDNDYLTTEKLQVLIRGGYLKLLHPAGKKIWVVPGKVLARYYFDNLSDFNYNIIAPGFPPQKSETTENDDFLIKTGDGFRVNPGVTTELLEGDLSKYVMPDDDRETYRETIRKELGI